MLRGRGIKRASAYRDEIQYVERHECEIRLGYSFPQRPPEVRWITPVFHPNISYSGYLDLKVCGLSWQEDLSLEVVCERVWDLARLAWFDLDTASNHSAKKWFAESCDLRLPVDARPLRDLGGPAASNVVHYQRGPASSTPKTDEGILYIGEDTPTPKLPQPRPRRRPNDDDYILYIGDD